MSDNIKNDFQFKILFLGDSEVGKTSILVRYAEGKFESNGLPTLGVDLIYKYIKIDNKSIRLDLWDTAGEERFRNIASNHYKGANGIIFVFDITKYETFKKLRSWIEDVKENVSPDSQMAIAGNKSDLEDRRQVEKEMVDDFCKQHNLKYFEISAKSGNGINEVFDYLIKQLLSNNKLVSAPSVKEDPISRNNSVVLSSSIPKEKIKHNCQC